MTENIDNLWLEYTKSRTKQVRDKLAEHYQSLVGYVAKGFQLTGSSVLDWQDLVSAGTLGLLEAIDRFDPSRNIKFTTFATFRIRGSILDILREIDWAPRKVRSNVKLVYKTISELQNKLSRNPTEEEVADKMAIPLKDYYKILESMHSDRFLSLQDVLFEQDSHKVLRESFVDNYQDEDDFSKQTSEEMQHQLKDILKNLPTKERLVLTLYYYEGLNLADIATVLDVTESRVCQIHSQSLLLVKSKISKKDLLHV